jgi:hypothetical protein
MNTVILAVVGTMTASFVLPGVGLGQTNASALAKEIRISGRVIDPSGAALSRITVTLTAFGSEQPAKTVLTDEEGRFALTVVSPLHYEVRFEFPGFKSLTIRSGTDPTSNDIDVGTVTLEIGEVTEGPMWPVKRPRKIKPLTVCELLGNLKQYTNTDVAVVGRMDQAGGLIDHYEYLVQHHCKHPIVTEGHVWPSKILIWSQSQDGMPKAPSDQPELDHKVFMEKFAALHRNTKLGSHKEPRFKKEGSTISFSHLADVRDDWVVAYGRIVSFPKLLTEPCGDRPGCGGFTGGAPVMIIVELKNVHTISEDGSLRRPSEND